MATPYYCVAKFAICATKRPRLCYFAGIVIRNLTQYLFWKGTRGKYSRAETYLFYKGFIGLLPTIKTF